MNFERTIEDVSLACDCRTKPDGSESVVKEWMPANCPPGPSDI